MFETLVNTRMTVITSDDFIYLFSVWYGNKLWHLHNIIY